MAELKRFHIVTGDRPRRRRSGSRGGLSSGPEYQSWYGANERCSNPKSRAWRAYGGRGIRVCERWAFPDGFERFLVDMGPRPPGMSLDRIDVNGNYEPSNCRWADLETQQTNKRPMSRGFLRERQVAMRALSVPRRLERLEDRMLREIASALREEFGPTRNPETINPADFQISEAVISGYEFRGVDVGDCYEPLATPAPDKAWASLRHQRSAA